MSIVPVTDSNSSEWAALCNELWPHNSKEEMLEAYAAGELRNEYLYQTDGVFIAFVSLSLRTDYVEGKQDANPVGYLEAIYVKAEHRGTGVARELVAFAKRWSAERGCTMLASDCELDNHNSRAFHNAVGFMEEGVNIHFGMKLSQ